MSSSKNKGGLVYSTKSGLVEENQLSSLAETLNQNKQKLAVRIEKKNRGGKTVTIVAGFVGKESDLDDLAKKLKSKCGVGGTSKDGEIIIQGEFRERIVNLLKEMGYNAK